MARAQGKELFCLLDNLMASLPAYTVKIWYDADDEVWFAHVVRTRDGGKRIYKALDSSELLDVDVAGFVGGYDG